jgi:hypothetical protein
MPQQCTVESSDFAPRIPGKDEMVARSAMERGNTKVQCRHRNVLNCGRFSNGKRVESGVRYRSMTTIGNGILSHFQF